nr:4Fe-4S dicluster domain-containing protein [Muribaculaceae bacterium]
LIEAAGGMPENSGKIISGGPMMGKAVVSLDAPVTKAVSGVVVLPESQSHRGEERQCVRCSKCVSVCPMGLEPYLLMTLSSLHLQQEAEERGIMNCLECGCCQYICPSYRPLLDSIRLSKSIIRKNQKK